ncbi:MAG: inosine/xanthosine triphosphatase [Sulfolobales archaeon]
MRELEYLASIMIRVAVGSGNKVKLAGVLRAFRDLMGSDVEILSTPVETDLSQPVGLDLLIKLSCIRALKSMEKVRADFYVGVEAGFHVLDRDVIINIHVACIMRNDGMRFLGFSQAFEISREIYEGGIRSGELEKYIESVTGLREIGSSIGLVGLATRGRISREDLVYGAVSMALVSMILKERGLEDIKDSLKPFS